MRNTTHILKKILIIFFISFFSANIFAEQAPLMTLKEAILLSLRFNPSVQTGELQRVLDKYTLRVAQWAFEPQYSLTGSATYAHGTSNGVKSESDSENLTPGASILTPIGTKLSVQSPNTLSHTANNASYYNPAVTFSLTQPLLQGSGSDVVLGPLHNAEYTAQIAALNFKNTVITGVTNVISQYALVANAQLSIKTSKLSLENANATLKQQEAYLKIGRIAPADLSQSQATVASQLLSLQQQEVSLLQQKKQLLVTLGIDPNLPFSVTDEVKFDDTLPSLNECVRLGLENNITYLNAVTAVKQAKITLLLAQDQQRWVLNLTASRTQGAGTGGSPNSGLSSLTNGNNNNTSVALNLTVPIDNLTLKQTLATAKVGLDNANINLETQKRSVVNSVTTAYNTVINQKQQIKQAETSVMFAQQTLDTAQVKLKYGKVSAFEVSTLQNNLLTAQIAYINTVTAYYTNLATLDQTMGTTLDRWKIQLKY